MAFEFIKYEKHDRVAYITINRPERLNALHPPASNEIADAFDDFAADNNSWIAVITGAGEKAFSAGNDLRYTAEHQGEKFPPMRHGFGGFTARYDINKPIIAAVNGFALGGGFEIALASDLVIAADNAKFGLPEPRVGLLAYGGGVHRLPRQLPLKIAMGMLLTGKQITAQEAHRIGIVNEVVPQRELRAAVDRWVAQILECAPLSVRASKEAAMNGLGLPLGDAAKQTYPAVRAMFGSHDSKEGPRAFTEKRKPNWRAE